MKVSFPVKITEDVTGTLTIQLKVGKEMLAHAISKGYDPTEIENAAGQRMQEIASDIADIVGASYDE